MKTAYCNIIVWLIISNIVNFAVSVGVLDNTLIRIKKDLESGQYSFGEKYCFSKKKFLSSNKCYETATRGPCKEDEWFVMDKSGQNDRSLRPICKKKLCLNNSEIWWREQNKCIAKTDIKNLYCNGENKIITNNMFGEGICKCVNEFVSFERNGPCYEYYQRGPCRQNEVVTHNSTSGFAVCSIDRCLRENSRLNENRSRYSNARQNNISAKRKEYGPMRGTGRCYKLQSADPCADFGEQSRYVIDQLLHMPMCSEERLELGAIFTPDLCVSDNNKCRDSVLIKSDAFINEFDWDL